MYNVLKTLSKYIYFYISKNINSYTFLLVFKLLKSLQCILKVNESRYKQCGVIPPSKINFVPRLVIFRIMCRISFNNANKLKLVSNDALQNSLNFHPKTVENLKFTSSERFLQLHTLQSEMFGKCYLFSKNFIIFFFFCRFFYSDSTTYTLTCILTYP